MDNEILRVMKSRRSVRQFKPQQISETELQAVLEAGMYAPNGKGAQSPIIVVVQDAASIGLLCDMKAALLGNDPDPYYSAPTILLVLANRYVNTRVEDGSCVLANMLNAAHAIGLGSCWIHHQREIFDSREGRELLKKWGVRGDYQAVGACILGYAATPLPAPAPRKATYIIKIS